VRKLLVLMAMLGAVALGIPSSDANTVYTYDQLGRLASANYDNGVEIVYTYDAAGNRTSVARTAVPLAKNDAVTADENQSATFDPRVNDGGLSSYTLTISAIGTPSHGSATINGGTSVTYTPVTGYIGTDSFSYSVTDGHGFNSTAAVNVTVVPVPVVNNVSVSANENSAVTFNPLTSDSAPAGYPLSISAVGTPSHGTAVNNGTSIVYTPNSTFSGTDSFGYTVSDGQATASATITVTVNVVPPTCQPVSYTGQITYMPNPIIPTPQTGYNSGICSDPFGYTLTIISVSAPSYGTATILTGSSCGPMTTGGTNYPTQCILYAPNSSSGSDSYTYTVSDGYGGTAVGTVTLNYSAPPNPPPCQKLGTCGGGGNKN